MIYLYALALDESAAERGGWDWGIILVGYPSIEGLRLLPMEAGRWHPDIQLFPRQCAKQDIGTMESRMTHRYT